MNTNKTVLSLALISALGAAAVAPQASAVILSDGQYHVYVNVTPVTSTGSGQTLYDFGTDGAWNSSFSFGGAVPASDNLGSYGLTDNGATSGTGQGSSINGDGYAGHWVIVVAGTSVTFQSFSQDTIFNTALGDFAQYGTGQYGMVSGTGTIDQTTGMMSITPTGRLAATNSPVLTDISWNIDDCDMSLTGCANNGNTVWSALTTGTATSYSPTGVATTINGAAVTALGDVDSDGFADYSAILVSGGRLGSAWINFGASYFETYNVRIESNTIIESWVPVPPAIWLFGSGILGLGAMARRKRRHDFDT
jgi:hypothetical protein